MILTACRMLIGLMMIACLGVASGCGYSLRGKVVQGPVSGVEIVHETDQRLDGPGLANTEVLVRRDPESLRPHLVGQARTNSAGEFTMRIAEFGAGWMQELWLVQSTLSGHQNAHQLIKLPGKSSRSRLLITLAPGTATPVDQKGDYMQDFEQFR